MYINVHIFWVNAWFFFSFLIYFAFFLWTSNLWYSNLFLFMYLERPCWWNIEIPRPYKILMRRFLPGVRRLNISPQSDSFTETRPLQPFNSPSQDSSPRLELGFPGKSKFLVWEMPHQQRPSSFPGASWLPAGLLDAHLFAQDLLSSDLPWVEQTLQKSLPQLGLAAPPKQDLCCTSVKKKGSVSSPKEAPRRGPKFSPRVTLVLSHPLLLSLCSHPTFPAVHTWVCGCWWQCGGTISWGLWQPGFSSALQGSFSCWSKRKQIFSRIYSIKYKNKIIDAGNRCCCP